MYFPSPIKGQKYKGHVKISRAQLDKYLSQEGVTFTGFIVGNKVSRSHFFNMWNLACPLEGLKMDAMNRRIDWFEAYLEPELGNRAAIYLKK